MRKLLVILAVLASLNLSCEPKCGCAPPPPAIPLRLVVKSVSGEDLLNPNTAGSFSLNEIQLYKKSADGKNVPIKFDIGRPVPAGADKIDFYQIVSSELKQYGSGTNWFSTDIPYLQFRDEQPLKVLIQFDSNRKIDLYLNGYAALKESKAPYDNILFYFTKK